MTLMIGEYTLVGNVDEILEFMRKNTPCVSYGTITPHLDSGRGVSDLVFDDENKTSIKPKLVKESDGNLWDPQTGFIYDSNGVLVAHDCVYRGNEQPTINLNDYEIVEEVK